MKAIENKTDIGILIFRVLIAVLLLFHGFGNLLSGYGFIKGVMTQSGLPEFMSYGAFFGEIVAPLFIIVGFKERIASLIVALTMFIAVLTTHASDVFALNQFGGWAIELQAFYLFGAIAIFFTGAGKFSVSRI